LSSGTRQGGVVHFGGEFSDKSFAVCGKTLYNCAKCKEDKVRRRETKNLLMSVQRIVPFAGQESVWDYPRPPRVEPTAKQVRVVFHGVVIAETRNALRVLETSHPPVYYIPPQAIRMEFLHVTAQQTFCEFKGAARYYTVTVGDKTSENAAWFYPQPARGYQVLQNYVAFYPQRVEACFVDGERVTPQPGDFYGGWITHDIVGPFKGAVGTHGW
jgi:uncharacterized protein (DUF427 family)